MGNPLSLTPETEYENRHGDCTARVWALERRERLVGRLRIAEFLLLVLLLLVFPVSTWWALTWLLPAAGVFIATVNWHRRIVAALAERRRAQRYFAWRLACVRDDWIGRGAQGTEYADVAHPYSADLDIFGRGSLFQYLCAAVTPIGRDTLADWLKSPATQDAIRQRQAAIAELRSQVDLREALGRLSDPEHSEQKSRALETWPAAPPELSSRAGPVAATLLGTLGLCGILAWAGFGTGPSPLLLVIIVEIIFVAWQWRRIRVVMRDARPMLQELQTFLPVLQLVENLNVSSQLLRSLRNELQFEAGPPSHQVAQLTKLLDSWDSCLRNQFVLPIAFVLMVPMQLVYAIERWRLRAGRHVRQWLNGIGAFEALCSLSTLAYEHADYSFAELLPDGPVFEAVALGHPLLPAVRRVTNDLRLGVQPALLLVSGSNMSGKSTLMRAVGVNAVLALAGAPVCARRLAISPLAVATAMRQADSLHDGVSAFYAEIRRLQAIREWTAKALPVLFLLDEILRGTNSHDRRIGADAVIQTMLERGAVGMVSTHDLALAEIVDRLGARAANVHFEDQLTNGQVSFDYRLRPGVVPRGNGLVLLRLLGFDV